MKTATRLGLYGAGLAVVFGGAFTAADAVVPESAVSDWTEAAKAHEVRTVTTSHGADDPVGGQGITPAEVSDHGMVRGVTSAQGGYVLSAITGPGEIGETGKLSFRILDARGDAETSFATSHERRLHLVVVRTDGTFFRHVHPAMDAEGTWSLPWTWAAAGTYRLYADFVPAGSREAEPLTLTRTVEVAGAFTPAPPEPNDTTSVHGLTVKLTGDLLAGSSSELTLTVSRDGRPVTTLQPYLGAFGHLVALREGDLAYLHVHPEGDQPHAAELAGPEIAFAAEAPTPGRYLLYLDFKVDGNVHTASFVVDTEPGGGHSH
jgi:hypothetical protein